MTLSFDDEAWKRIDSISVILYDEPCYPGFEIGQIADHLAKNVGVGEVVLRGRLLRVTVAQSGESLQGLATTLASCRITDPSKSGSSEPAKAEVDHERRQLLSHRVAPGLVYDGLAIQRILFGLLPEDERTHDHLHIVFTNRLIATIGRGDSRYHLRTIICGFPCIVSLTGLVEAPARDQGYYISRRYSPQPGIDDQLASDDHLGYGDPRTTMIAMGYAIQSLSYMILGDPFCPRPQCRLYNAHRQVEMLKAQMSLPEYCEEHAPLLARHRRSGRRKDAR